MASTSSKHFCRWSNHAAAQIAKAEDIGWAQEAIKTIAKVVEGVGSHQINHQNHIAMHLGAFSASLAVKDLAVSKAFYEKLGFNVFAGAMDKNYLIMKNGNALIGLFQGMFEQNILTFNPGWDENAQPLDEFEDVRTIQQALKKEGLTLLTEADETTSGPASFVLTDPDGNTILIDQHR